MGADTVARVLAAAVRDITLISLAQVRDLATLVIPAGRSSFEAGTGAARGTYVADDMATATLAGAFPQFCVADRGGRHFRLMPTDGTITAEQCGVDPGTDINAGQKITDGFKYLRTVNDGGTIALQPDTTYTVSMLAEQTVGTVKSCYAGCLFIPPRCRLRAMGATIKAYDGNTNLIHAHGDIFSSHVVSGPMQVGAVAFRLAAPHEVARFAVGERVLWRLGDVPFDLPETINSEFATVVAIDAANGTVVVNKGLKRAWDGRGVNNCRIYRVEPITGLIVDDVRFEPVSATHGAQAGLAMTLGESTIVGRVEARGCYAGAYDTQYVRDSHAKIVIARDNPYTAANQGMGSRHAESSGRIDVLITDDCYSQSLVLEDGCDFSIGTHVDHNRNRDTLNGVPLKTAIFANGWCRVHVERATYEGVGGSIISATPNSSAITFGSLRIEVDSDIFAGPMPGYEVDRLELSIGGTEELYLGSRAKLVEQTLVADGSGAAVVALFPKGLIAKVEVIPLSGLVSADLDALYVGRYFGTTSDMKSLIPPTPSTLEIDILRQSRSIGTMLGGLYSQRTTHSWMIQADFAVGVPAPKGLKVRCLIVPNEYGSGSSHQSEDLRRGALSAG